MNYRTVTYAQILLHFILRANCNKQDKLYILLKPSGDQQTPWSNLEPQKAFKKNLDSHARHSCIKNSLHGQVVQRIKHLFGRDRH